ncbi:carboxylesterase family protein-like protein [Penicillium pulvis]|uniref:carboxylesterase family protein-like protein n=1 Tax=Penicillium pulvis TaxID=1562058 RepID=UPI002547873B|nr:carboxylesterase family protein-like protein [Penicillium pulvis]KAJ5792460.1 carboxylesterase family protein-like protein [Penicillium pulvis]
MGTIKYTINNFICWTTSPGGILQTLEASDRTYTDRVLFTLNRLGYTPNPFLDKQESYTVLSYLMSNSWASFVYGLNPSDLSGRGRNATQTNRPAYTLDKPMNMVWDANKTSYPEPDTWRKEGIDWINEHALNYQR